MEVEKNIMDKAKIYLVCLIILIIGGLNWGFAGLFGYDLLTLIFGSFARVLFIIVGIAAIYILYTMIMERKSKI